jgi:O-antigen/teichoic acid export membrane protein
MGLRSNFSWTFLGNLIYGISQWLFLFVIAKVGTPEMIGDYSLGLAIVTPVILFANLHLRSLQVTDFKGQHTFPDYLALRLVTAFSTVLIVFLLSKFSGYGESTQIIVLIIGLAKSIEAVSDIFYGLFQKNERMDCVSKSTTLRSILSVGFFSVLLILTKNFPLAVSSLILSNILTLSMYDVWKYKTFFTRLNIPHSSLTEEVNKPYRKVFEGIVWSKILKLAIVGLPLGCTTVFLALSANFPRYFIASFIGQKELGFFSAISYIPLSGVILIGAVGQSILPRLAKYHSVDRSAFFNLLIRVLLLGVVLGVVGILISFFYGEQLLRLMYNSSYSRYSGLFMILMIDALLSYVASLLGYAVTAARYFKGIFIVVALTTSITFLVSFISVSTLGLYGAAGSLIVNSCMQILGYSFLLLFFNKNTKDKCTVSPNV